MSKLLNCSYSPTVKKYGAVTVSENVAYSPPAKVIDFKPATLSHMVSAPVKEKSGEQSVQPIPETAKRVRGAINLNQLDALEL
jgi:hypothetical protein